MYDTIDHEDELHEVIERIASMIGMPESLVAAEIKRLAVGAVREEQSKTARFRFIK